jgi:hypothetical protein
VKEGDLSRAQEYLRRVVAREPDKLEAQELLAEVEAELALGRPGYAQRNQELTTCRQETIPLRISPSFSQT